MHFTKLNFTKNSNELSYSNTPSTTEWPDTGKCIVKLALALIAIAGLFFITGVALLVAVAVVVVHPPNGSK